ncbi:hypothetical protein BC332_24236 [Capsicum chinense]|nr:hypothetical protein BC332_24236 [Capsicum chinense]
MRGCVFLEKKLPDSTTSTNDSIILPPICISKDISRFPYTNRGGSPSAIRVARVVSEIVALNLNHSNVKWFVFGDDDTIFFEENLVKTLSKYDNGLWYYIGSNSESFIQNKFFSFEMAFGGAGFAISYPLAKVLARVLDSCIERYPHLYGSDGRIHACLTELGVTLSHEPGFHQMDVNGNAFGLLAAHPIRPLVSLHHMEKIDPIFPYMSRMKALQHLYHAATFDPHRILQQTVCYDSRFSWTISVSWGYVVQIFEHNVQMPDAQRVQESYLPWKKNAYGTLYEFNNRKFESDPCRRQVVYFLDEVSMGIDGIKTIYKKKTSENCILSKNSPRKLEEIGVFSHKLELDKKQMSSPGRSGGIGVLYRWVKGSSVSLHGLGQSSPHELTFEIELGPRCPALGVRGGVGVLHRWVKGSLISLYGLGQSSPHELAFDVKLDPMSISLSATMET